MKKRIIIVVTAAILIVAGIGGGYFYLQKQKADMYAKAVELMQAEDYKQAIDIFGKMKDYEDSGAHFEKCKEQIDLQEAEALYKKGDFSGAKELYEKYEVSDKLEDCAVGIATDLNKNGKYEEALNEIEAYKDKHGDLYQSIQYAYAKDLYAKESYEESAKLFLQLKDYEDSQMMMGKCLIGRKYMKFDFEHFDLGGADTDGLTHKDIISEVEDQLSGLFYKTWYKIGTGYNDDFVEFTMDETEINGKRYGISSFENSTMMFSLEYFYLDSPDKKYSLNVGVDLDYVEAGKFVYNLNSNDEQYCDLKWNELEELDSIQSQIDEAKEAKVTKQTVYYRAQKATKDYVFRDLNNYQRLIMSSSIAWYFQNIDSILYSYDYGTRIHSIEFCVTYVKFQELEQSESITLKYKAAYREDDFGTLEQMDFQSLGVQ